jgi:hypothetical protein
MNSLFFLTKVFLSGILIATSSWAAGKKPALAGFIIALPLASMLSILFSYWQYRDMEKINQFAASIFVVVPLSLTFFIPFLLNRWLKMNFAMTFLLALVCLAIAYGVGTLIFKLDLTK